MNYTPIHYSCYPIAGNQIDTVPQNSPYHIKIIPPTDLSKSFFEYGENFFQAAYYITSKLLYSEDRNIAELDSYFFPIAFLYRHSLELGLKAIAFQRITSDTDRVDFMKSTCHNLHQIFLEIQSISSFHRPEDEITWLEEFLRSISQIDKESDSFRYPFHIVFSKVGDFDIYIKRYSLKRIFEKRQDIDLIKFANKFIAAFNIIEQWYNRTNLPTCEWRSLSSDFLESGGHYYSKSVIGYEYSHYDFHIYTKAYLEVANHLKTYALQSIDSHNSHIANQLFFPMCYLYRNCVELGLKSIFLSYTNCSYQDKCKTIAKKKHSILALWHKIDSTAALWDSTGNTIGPIKDYCNQIHCFDTTSDRFRYPISKDLDLHFSKETFLDFKVFGDFLEALNNALEDIATVLDIQKQAQAEYEYENQDYN